MTSDDIVPLIKGLIFAQRALEQEPKDADVRHAVLQRLFDVNTEIARLLDESGWTRP